MMNKDLKFALRALPIVAITLLFGIWNNNFQTEMIKNEFYLGSQVEYPISQFEDGIYVETSGNGVYSVKATVNGTSKILYLDKPTLIEYSTDEDPKLSIYRENSSYLIEDKEKESNIVGYTITIPDPNSVKILN